VGSVDALRDEMCLHFGIWVFGICKLSHTATDTRRAYAYLRGIDRIDAMSDTRLGMVAL
jgi:hypothetical protein